jgi:hypothetical protein
MKKKKMAAQVKNILLLLFTLVLLTGIPVHLEAGNNESAVLETDDISIVLEGDGLWIRITPVDESILNYCTEDTKRTYTTILKSHPEIPADTKQKMFLVMFQGRKEPETYFEPTELEILTQGNRLRPQKIVPHSSTFNKRVLKFYGTPEMAIYIFSQEIDLLFPITFKYRSLENKEWEQRIITIKKAKARYGTR